MSLVSDVTSLLARARKAVVAVVGVLAVVVPLVANLDPAVAQYWAAIVTVLTALGVYAVPNAAASAVRTAPPAGAPEVRFK